MNLKLQILKKVVLVLVVITVVSWLVMNLWNWLMPALFSGIHQVDYLHAMGLLVLSRILFGGFRGHGGRHGGWHGHHRKMSPEEREKFRKGMAAWHEEDHQ
jgi:hypothetical protein